VIERRDLVTENWLNVDGGLINSPTLRQRSANLSRNW